MTSAIPGSSGYEPVQGFAPSLPPRIPPGMEAAAKTLGLSPDELRSALRSGASLDDLATQKGVAKSDLVAAMAQDMKAKAPAGATGIDYTAMAEQLVGKLPGSGSPAGPPQPPPPVPDDSESADSPVLTALSGVLDMSASDLRAALMSGTRLADLLESRGISTQGLQNQPWLTQGILVDTRA